MEMKEYTVRLYLNNLIIKEYNNIIARNEFVAKAVAIRQFINSGVAFKIDYVSVIEKQG